MGNLKGSGQHLPGGPPGGTGNLQVPGPISISVDDASTVAVEGINIANAATAVAVHGNAPQGYGLRGDTTSGRGVYGSANNGVGMFGESKTGDAIVGLSHSSQHAGVSAQNDGGGPAVWASAKQAGQFNGDVHVTGTLTVDVDVVLTNAGDFAEEFDVTCAADAEPGTVMCLDGEGSVRPARSAYDRKVAGIVSGAGDYRPGIVLDKRASEGSRAALALVGKVYCKVDASYGAIAVGDLLTTSPTLGHAMKASDPARAFGAVIGKALAPLAEGRGLVPVLVAMQ